MLHIIIGINRDDRKKKRDAFIEHAHDVIMLDDTNTSFSLLVEYAFPSLFSVSVPVVHARHLLEKKDETLLEETIRTLVASPTVFILEEYTLSAPVKKTFEKHGTFIYEHKEAKKTNPQSTIFSVTEAITAKNKKDRWFAYRQSLQEHPVEALLGILFWKLRQLLEKPSKEAMSYKKLYTELLLAQQSSWQKGFPLALAIEKVILQS